MKHISGLGNPLLDTIIKVDFDTFTAIDAEPGSMNLVDSDFSQKLLALPGKKKRTPGGSSANTMRGIAWLQQNTTTKGDIRYLGSVGKDKEGDQFEQILKDQGVIPHLSRTEVATGTSTILVTPDHERTMFTYLGACREYSAECVEKESINEADIIHLAGYMWDTEPQKGAAKYLVEYAMKGKRTVSFDLADPFVVHRFGDELRSWLPGKIDILFANQEELSVMTGEKSAESIISKGAEIAPTVIMKTGADGCVIAVKGEILTVPGFRVEPTDTTGAGDSFAAGYLFGLLHDYLPEECGILANKIASRIVTTEGCDYSAVSFGDVAEAVK